MRDRAPLVMSVGLVLIAGTWLLTVWTLVVLGVAWLWRHL